ncbi:hypothetical protein ABB37_10144 [Leptomonas pyrrhocoris]|uniref:Uncharacterized protein n=1 Tax=Leptomonas pyrrhocoris TaxID=157538 RepID=A0A0M9FNW0_LEPPY|nr:hypothetical protein ABB37_10144 [Leptomonas pyrrhocoris]KPA73070.1 hypothetical protein ABB37_10144 [Leptomonas pyrrhocoris]|eukprot:XP_015651509.1 hypothetical protein ABB37_10144 [Leptomonas pyrrhocoris]
MRWLSRRTGIATSTSYAVSSCTMTMRCSVATRTTTQSCSNSNLSSRNPTWTTVSDASPLVNENWNRRGERTQEIEKPWTPIGTISRRRRRNGLPSCRNRAIPSRRKGFSWKLRKNWSLTKKRTTKTRRLYSKKSEMSSMKQRSAWKWKRRRLLRSAKNRMKPVKLLKKGTSAPPCQRPERFFRNEIPRSERSHSNPRRSTSWTQMTTVMIQMTTAATRHRRIQRRRS